MRPRAALAALLMLALGASLAAAADPLLKERIWTDQQGRKMRGRFERMENGNIVLNSGGTLTTVPISQLSDADQAFLDDPSPAPAATGAQPAEPAIQDPAPAISTPRNWTINGRQMVGGIKSADERGLVLATAAGEFRLTYDVLADEADLLEASKYLTSIGRGDLAQKLQDTFEKNSGRAFPLPRTNTAPKANPVDDDLPVGGDDPLYNDSPDKVLDVDVPPPTRERPDFRTADQLLDKEEKSPAASQADEQARFQRTVIGGAITLFIAIGAIVTYGWWASRK